MEKYIRLNANENPYDDVMERVFSEISKYYNKLNRYPDENSYELRKAYGKYINKVPEKIMFGNGSDEAISIIMDAYLKSGSKFFTLNPDFSMYDFYAKKLGAGCEKISILDGKFTIDKFIEKVIEKNVQMIIFSNPNNPTGKLFKRAEIKKILAAFSKIPVVIDEAYGEFAEESMLEFIEEYSNLYVTKTLSKAFAMAGLRIGCAVSNEKNISYLNKFKPPYNVNSLSQRFGAEVLKNVDYMREAVKKILKERDLMYKFLKDMESENFKVYETGANFICFESKNCDEINEYLLKNDILIRSFPDLNLLRVTVGKENENLKFKEVMEELKNHGKI